MVVRNTNGITKRLDQLEKKFRPPKVEIEKAGDTVTVKWNGQPVKVLLRKFWESL